jgi:hypothetical protein
MGSQGTHWLAEPGVRGLQRRCRSLCLQYSINKSLYALRSRIECFIGHLKEQRRIATRYDKLATSFVGFVLHTAQQNRQDRHGKIDEQQPQPTGHADGVVRSQGKIVDPVIQGQAGGHAKEATADAGPQPLCTPGEPCIAKVAHRSRRCRCGQHQPQPEIDQFRRHAPAG